nr:hypothetical protein [Archangium sp. Cb G35]
MNQHNGVVAPQDNIGFPRKLAGMEPETQPHPVQGAADGNLRLRIRGPDPPHVLASRRTGQGIRHW